MGTVRLRHYEERWREIHRAMKSFRDQLEGTPRLRPHRVDPAGDSDMGRWYAATGHCVAEELGGQAVTRFA